MKSLKKVIAVFLAAITIFSAFNAVPFVSANTQIVAMAADTSGTWKKENGTWYYYLPSGEKATGWVEINNNWYCFSTSGAMITGWHQSSAGNWYYLSPSKTDKFPEGAMVTGWLEVNDNWYYFNSNGILQTGWQEINSNWYCFSTNGAMITGWHQSSAGNWYYFSPSKTTNFPKGAAVKGWQKINNKWYYFSKETGSNYKICEMYKGWNEISGKRYYFDSSGVLQTGWVGSKENGWFYSDDDGVMVTGWLKIDGKWYYFTPTADSTYKLGQMVKGSYIINGKTYVFNSDGSAFSGVKNGVYYKDGSPIENGWTSIDGKWVYIQDGKKLTNTWLDNDGKWYYLQSDGTMKTSTWFQYTDKNGTTGWYYLQSDGSAATGQHRINGKNYSFNSSGRMLKEEAPSASSTTHVDYINTPYTYWSPFSNANKTYQLHKIGNQYAYCMQFNRSSRTGNKTVQTLTETAAWKSLTQTAQTGITRATIVGYPNYDLGVSNTTAAAAATAMVIHEYQMGYRTSCGTDSPKTGLNSSVKNYDVLYNMAYKAGGDLWTAYRNVTKNIANFAVKPSFSGKTYVVKENDNGTYTYTLTDSKGVLKDYVVAYTTNRNLTATINGNKLTVTSAEKLNTVNVVLSKKGTTANTQKYGSAVALFDNSNYQTLVYGSLFEAANATVKFTFEEEVVYGSLEITKIDGDTKETLSGAEFTLYNSVGSVYKVLTTNAAGKASLSNIPVGTYKLVESKAPTGYPNNGWSQKITISKDVNHYSYTVENIKAAEKPKGDLYIFKRNQLTQKIMGGAKFNIYADENIYRDINNTDLVYEKDELIEKQSPVVLNDDGFAFVDQLYIGKYYAIEIEAPKGFKINPEKQYFEIKENTRTFTSIPSVTLDEANAYDDVAGIYEYGTVTVNVESSASSSEKVNGAIISAYYTNSDGEEIRVGTGVTDEGGLVTFTNVALGLEYNFKQVDNANTDYMLADENYEITLNEDKTSSEITFKNALSPDASVIDAVTMLSVYDEPFIVTLYKKDKDTLQGLPNAIINVYNADGATAYSGTTDENGEFKITGIPAGEYTFEEIQAPDGYILNAQIHSFTINEDGTVTGDDTILDEKTKVTLHKTDLTTAEGVPDATIVVTDTDGEAVFEGVTNEDGDITIIGLTPGTYYFTETVAPAGYIRNTTVFEFTLNRDGTIEGDDTITNEPTSVVIQKFAEDTNAPQPGAEFEFFNSDGTSVGKFTTDDNGEITFSKLPIGTYSYKETKAPEGYALNTTLFTFTLNEDGTVTGDTVVVNKPTTVIITKVKAGTDKPVEGAEFELFNSEGNSLGMYVTNEDGQIVLTKLPVGAYTYQETKAPEGFVLNTAVYSFEIAEDGTVTGTLTVENEEEPTFKMPKTGAKSLLLMGGIALACFLVSIIISKKKKKNDGETAATNN